MSSTAAAANIKLQSIERRRHNDSWLMITRSSEDGKEDGNGEGEGDEATWRGNGSQDRIVRVTSTIKGEGDGSGLSGNEAGGRIMKTTQFTIEYDSTSEKDEKEMAYNKLGLKRAIM